MSASEREVQEQKDSKLEEWKKKLSLIEVWLAEEGKKLESDRDIATDLDTVTKQRREMEVGVEVKDKVGGGIEDTGIRSVRGHGRGASEVGSAREGGDRCRRKMLWLDVGGWMLEVWYGFPLMGPELLQEETGAW